MSVLPALSHSLLRDVLSKVAQSRITAQELQASLHSQLSGGINVVNHGPALQIAMFPCLQDNYGYLVKYGGSDAGSGGSPPAVFCVDVPEAQQYLAVSQKLGWQPLTHILLTHHHWDHAGGVPELLRAFPEVEIFAGEREVGAIESQHGFAVPKVGRFRHGETKALGAGLNVRALHVPGHTMGHTTFLLPDYELAFTGDTLFAMGCGRVFEGTLAQMDESLNKILRDGLSKNCLIYCGHEYTEKNGQFALSVDSGNKVLGERMQGVALAGERNLPCVPTLMELELATNPFFRCEGLGGFEKVRKAKDNF